MKRLCSILLLAALACAVLAAQETPQAILARMEKALAAIDAFQSDFEQSSYSQAVSKPLFQKGRLTFSKPDRHALGIRRPREEYLCLQGRAPAVLFSGGQPALAPDASPRKNTKPKSWPCWPAGAACSKIHRRGQPVSRRRPRHRPAQADAPGGRRIIPTCSSKSTGPAASIRRVIFFGWGGDRQEFVFSRFKTGIKPSEEIFRDQSPQGLRDHRRNRADP